MHSNIEIEAKVLLSKEQYDQVVSYLHLERYRKIKQNKIVVVVQSLNQPHVSLTC